MQKYELDKVNISFLQSDTKSLPLIISPRFDDSLEFICKWLKENRQWVEDQMLFHGAVLIRGFKIESAADFEKAKLAVQPNLCDRYRGTSPRTHMEDTKYSFSAADVPVNYPIAQHLEMSFLKKPPSQIFFGCMQESSSIGGETSLCDFRKVYQDISPELRDKLTSKNIKYTRKNLRVGEKYTFDVGAMKSWVELFGTSDQNEVESICREEEAPGVQWVGPKKDIFLQEWIDKPFQLHPETGEHVWFNHSQVFHWSTFPAELWFAFRRTIRQSTQVIDILVSLQLLIHFLLVSIFSVIKYGLFGYKMSLDTTFGDGSPITFKEMNEIRSVIHKHMVMYRWRKGDILCIDNFSTSHGRQPCYDRSRKVIVSWSQPRSKTGHQEISTLPPPKSSPPFTKVVPDLEAVTPGSSPESSLTKQEAEELQNIILSDKIKDKIQVKVLDQGQTNHIHRRLNSCPALFKANSEFWKGN